jgi:5-methylcytosine-specific restriction endonuclease McrA
MNSIKYQGKPCIHGHGTERYVYDKRCVVCASIRQNNYATQNPDKFKEIRKNYYKKNKEKLRTYNKIYNQKYLQTEHGKIKSRMYKAKRRALKKSNLGIVTDGIYKKLLTLQNGCCAICKEKKANFHLDHIIPLSKGGMHDDSNFQLLCQFCNISKNDHDPITYMQSKGYLL